MRGIIAARIAIFVVLYCIAFVGANPWFREAIAQTPMLPGFPPGTFQNRAAIDAAPAASYQGPGDVVGSAAAWGSCARVYTAAQASTSTSLCDLVAVTGGAAVCTLRGSSTGFVDLAASYCAGTTPAAACAAASGGSCKVTKVYDQTGGGNDFVQATLGNMPALTFSALGGLPGMTFAAGSGSMATAGNFTTAQPLTFSGVSMRTVAASGAVIGSASATVFLGGNASANLASVFGSSAANQTASDNAFHALQGVLNSASSVMVVDGSAGSTASSGGTAMSGTLRLGRTNAAVTMTGTIMEAGLWAIAFNSTQYGNMNTNQHSSANGYNF